MNNWILPYHTHNWRLGLGGGDNAEGHLVWKSLLVQAHRRFSASVAAAAESLPPADRQKYTQMAVAYNKTAAAMSAVLRAPPTMRTTEGGTSSAGNWFDDYGLHAAAHAMLAGVVETKEEADALVTKVFNDSVTVCSFSPFNTYFVLQALSSIGEVERASEVAKICWEPMTRLGHGCFWEVGSESRTHIWTSNASAR
jgi:hypothetical protein